MGRKPKFSKEEKIKACEEYKNGKGSFNSIAFNMGCNKVTVRRWYYRYIIHGPRVFVYSNKNRSCSKKFQLTLVIFLFP